MTNTYEFEDVTLETDGDVVPPAIDIEYPCVICGEEAGPYGGRGRKPRKCPKHKSAQSGTNVRVKGANAALAAQAAEALCQLNNILTMPFMLLRYVATASAVARANDGFREMAYNALLTDPKLSASIVRGGTSGGKVALVIAYGVLGSAVGPVFMMEHKAKQPEEPTELRSV